MKSPLKWAGGKSWLVPKLKEIYQGERLIEPFVGGMSVALGLEPKKAMLNDINPHLVSFYHHLGSGFISTEGFKNEKHYYYKSRTRFNELIFQKKLSILEEIEKSCLFYYLNKNGFNGLCRFSKRGFNVPFGRYKAVNYSLGDYSQIEKWQIWNVDYSIILKLSDENDFIFVDPPYDTEFTAYFSGGFAWEDQVRLCKQLASMPGKIVVTNQATDRVLDLYRSYGFEIEILDAPRRISCNGDRTPAKEMFATRF